MSSDEVKCFISYSHKDSKMCELFRTQIKCLERQFNITQWYDGKIPAGGNIDEHIKQELNIADVIFLLISPDYIASYYCYDKELKAARKRYNKNQCIIIPVILKSFPIGEYLFNGLKFVPTDGKPINKFRSHSDGCVDAINGIRNLIEDFYKELKVNPASSSNRSVNNVTRKGKETKKKKQSPDVKYQIIKNGKNAYIKLDQGTFCKLIHNTQQLPQLISKLDDLMNVQINSFSMLKSSKMTPKEILNFEKSNLKSFIMQIFFYIQTNLLKDSQDTCAHIRRKKQNSKQYFSFLNIGYRIEELATDLSTKPIDALGGMIECAKTLHMPAIKSFNQSRHDATHPNESISRDYITFTFEEILQKYNVDVSMCISVVGGNKKYRQETLLSLALLRIDKIIEKFLLQYISECSKLVDNYDIKKIF